MRGERLEKWPAAEYLGCSRQPDPAAHRVHSPVRVCLIFNVFLLGGDGRRVSRTPCILSDGRRSNGPRAGGEEGRDNGPC